MMLLLEILRLVLLMTWIVFCLFAFAFWCKNLALYVNASAAKKVKIDTALRKPKRRKLPPKSSMEWDLNYIIPFQEKFYKNQQKKAPNTGTGRGQIINH